MSRRMALRHLAVGIVGIPYTVVVMALLMVLLIPLWLLNNVWAVVTGSSLLAENSRVGYYLYWGQNNLQALTSGRGDFSFLP